MRAEIVFIIDGSASIYPKDFKKQIEFLESFVDHFTIGKNDVRVGAVTFGDKIIMDNTFGLTQYTSKDRLKSGLSQIDFRYKDGSSTQTYLAIKYARETLFRDVRPEVKKIAIVITDGRSTIPEKTDEEARKMRKDGIVILAIGVGKYASNEELRVITNRKDYVFMIDKYSLLKEIQHKLSEITCEHTDQGCNGKVDINFVFDSSSMGYEETNTVTTFIMDSIVYENFSEQNLRFGTITGKCQATKSKYKANSLLMTFRDIVFRYESMIY
ncbi:collagen alpha-4(VI) chain [Octopus bimaculoides]|nr:collagen alpha-4(VI) chain [Octopus bimaculoides]